MHAAKKSKKSDARTEMLAEAFSSSADRTWGKVYEPKLAPLARLAGAPKPSPALSVCQRICQKSPVHSPVMLYNDVISRAQAGGARSACGGSHAVAGALGRERGKRWEREGEMPKEPYKQRCISGKEAY